MARAEHDAWSGIFRVWTVFCLILLLVSQGFQGQASAGAGQALEIMEGLTRWAVPALFMLWGMTALDSGRSGVGGNALALVLPCFVLLVFWGALYAVAAHLLGGGSLSLSGVLSAFSFRTVFYNFAQYHVFDVGGLILYLSLTALFVFLTIQTLLRRRWN